MECTGYLAAVGVGVFVGVASISSLSPAATVTPLVVSEQVVLAPGPVMVQVSAVATGPPPVSFLRVKVTLFPPPGAFSRTTRRSLTVPESGMMASRSVLFELQAFAPIQTFGLGLPVR